MNFLELTTAVTIRDMLPLQKAAVVFSFHIPLPALSKALV
jgi:hypothetical protein